MIWKLAEVGSRPQCGSCGTVIPVGEPVALLTVAMKIRCQACTGAEPDWDAIEGAQERAAIQHEEARNVYAPARPTRRAIKPAQESR